MPFVGGRDPVDGVQCAGDRSHSSSGSHFIAVSSQRTGYTKPDERVRRGSCTYPDVMRE